MASTEFAARVRGLGDLRRALRRSNTLLDRGVSRHIREIGKRVRDKARMYAPIGPRRDPHRGDLRKSLRYSVTRRRASVYTNDPKAPVHEWGGTIRPRGAPIKIPRRQYVSRAVKDSRRFIDAEMLGLLDSIAREFDSPG